MWKNLRDNWMRLNAQSIFDSSSTHEVLTEEHAEPYYARLSVRRSFCSLGA